MPVRRRWSRGAGASTSPAAGSRWATPTRRTSTASRAISARAAAGHVGTAAGARSAPPAAPAGLRLRRPAVRRSIAGGPTVARTRASGLEVAMAETSPEKFEPFVPASQEIAEFTPRAIALGALFGILFGAATVYLALRAGLTVSASVPIAVLSIAVFKRVGSTILENNIVQTIGSAGESVAAGVVFTVPGFLFLSAAADGGRFFQYWPILMLSLAGGFLGVLM